MKYHKKCLSLFREYLFQQRSKCSGSCNNINNPYAKLYPPDVVKIMNMKVINLMSKLIKQDM